MKYKTFYSSHTKTLIPAA